MAEALSYDDLLSLQRKERKELLAKTQKMKHGIPKGDKKKKKEVATEIAQLLADLDIKHEKQLQEYEGKNEGELAISNGSNVMGETSADCSEVQDVRTTDGSQLPSFYASENKSQMSEGSQKLSKAQKRRNKKSVMEKERIKAIMEQEEKNLSGSRHIESEAIRKKLSDRNLVIHEIPSDGNCLYKAIEHQLSTLNLQETSVESLRELTSKYLLSHKEEYNPFLTDPETGDVMSEEQYIKYCEDIVKTSSWGGHVEIQALSNICGKPIEVIQAEGPSVIAGDEHDSPRLIISYHRHVYGLGEHYNSVVPAAC